MAGERFEACQGVTVRNVHQTWSNRIADYVERVYVETRNPCGTGSTEAAAREDLRNLIAGYCSGRLDCTATPEGEPEVRKVAAENQQAKAASSGAGSWWSKLGERWGLNRSAGGKM